MRDLSERVHVEHRSYVLKVGVSRVNVGMSLCAAGLMLCTKGETPHWSKAVDDFMPRKKSIDETHKRRITE